MITSTPPLLLLAPSPPPPPSEVKELDSNMQYLVYENHSKFITASETIKEVHNYKATQHPHWKIIVLFDPFNIIHVHYFKSSLPPSLTSSPAFFFTLKMKDDFQRLEDDMGRLSARMEEISGSSKGINTALADRRQQINKLTSVHHMLKKVRRDGGKKEDERGGGGEKEREGREREKKKEEGEVFLSDRCLFLFHSCSL